MTFPPGQATGAHPPDSDPVTVFESAESLGDGFRELRQSQGRSIAELSSVTRIHAKYLRAMEENDFALLPSRVFAIGYARGYALALGLDDQTAVERFKRESPDGTVPLQAPTGIAFEDVRRHSPLLVGTVAVIIVAVIGWNVFQRISQARAPQPVTIEALPDNWVEGDPESRDIVVLGTPQPPPPDQTTPGLYITPGLEAELTGVDPADPAAIAAALAAAPPVQAAFNPRGPVFGATAATSQVILQARKPASLVVTRSDGRVLFARQLAMGEAWRAPAGVSATVDVSDATAFDVYLNGEYGGPLPGTISPLAPLNTRAQALARQSAAAIEAERQAAVQARAAGSPPPVAAPATAPSAPAGSRPTAN
ncbi:helix-turn-helix domain-containing protein [Brevundimonas variabilis]|uniref:Helix-turn-helix domain-containing protein n=1 Tax=Brevundimonas variabilis TaxID=74312 RepID=A0A7W9CFY6_9CAUL|nr:helix-turn-helix domain-containing protein [Brevundimonas variabilis]MBB5744937.1 hypothetical protein [Brevundimonas variabilis]